MVRKIRSKRRDEHYPKNISRSVKHQSSLSNKCSGTSVPQLQKKYGNIVLQRMYESGALQTKLKIGKPGDKYEREADSVADRVMNMPEPNISRQEKDEEVQTAPLADQISPLVQRQPEDEEKAQAQFLQKQGEEEEVKKQPKDEDGAQAKLLQTKEDEEEVQKQPKEEDETPQAKMLNRQTEDEEGPAQTKLLQRQGEEEEARKQPEEEETPRAKMLQRQEEEKEAQAQPDEEEAAQAKSTGNTTRGIAPNIENNINSIRGGGQPLPESARAFFEPRFGADFSGVKVHTSANANYLAKSINAKAFTIGKDVVFGAGQYSPESSSGKQLMAHELTHVVQQNKGRVKKNRIQRWGPGDHYKLTTGAVQSVFSKPSGFFKNALGVSATKMDMKIPELAFNAGGKVIGKTPIANEKRVRLLQFHYLMNQFNARNHGEGGCYLDNESKAGSINIKQQNYYLTKAKMKSIPFYLANPVSKYPLALPILYDIGDAVHVAQDRGSHGEGALGKGHANEIMTGKNPDNPSLNPIGYAQSKVNTKAVLRSVFRILNAIFGLKFFDTLWAGIKKTGKAILQGLKTLKKTIQRIIRRVMRGLLAVFNAVLRGLILFVRGVVHTIKVIARGVSRIIKKILTAIKRVLLRIKAEARRILMRAVSIGKWILYKTIKTTKNTVLFLLKKGKKIFLKTVNGARKLFVKVGGGLKKVLHKTRQAAKKVKRAINWGAYKAKNIVLNAPGSIKRRVKASLKRMSGPLAPILKRKIKSLITR